jgi:hypothetical protein
MESKEISSPCEKITSMYSSLNCVFHSLRIVIVTSPHCNKIRKHIQCKSGALWWSKERENSFIENYFSIFEDNKAHCGKKNFHHHQINFISSLFLPRSLYSFFSPYFSQKNVRNAELRSKAKCW